MLRARATGGMELTGVALWGPEWFRVVGTVVSPGCAPIGAAKALTGYGSVDWPLRRGM